MADHDSFLPRFLECQHDLRAFIGGLVRDPVAREDVFQEVSMVLWKNFAKYDPTRPFGAWARGVAIRKIMENRRLRARLPDALTEDVMERVSQAFDQTEATERTRREDRERALRECVKELPPRSGELIAERYEKGRAIEELATDLGLSLDAIYQTLSRLRKLLRACVERRLAQMNSLL